MKKLLFFSIFAVFSIQGIDRGGSSGRDYWVVQGNRYRKIDIRLFKEVGNNVNLLNELIQEGADINAIGFGGVSFIMYSVLTSQQKVVNKLLELKVRLNDVDQNGNSLLMFDGGFLLLSDGISNINIIEKLIKTGADVNAQNKDGDTPLIFAVKRGQFKLVALFVKYGAFIDHKNSADKTAIDIAKERILQEDNDEDWKNIFQPIIDFLEKTRAENIAKRKQKIKDEAGKYISTGTQGPLQYILEYAEEYVPEQSRQEESKEAQEIK